MDGTLLGNLNATTTSKATSPFAAPGTDETMLRATPAAGTFAAAITQAMDSGNSKEQVRQSAQKLVASTFLLPLLQQMRKDPFRTKLFHGGFAEDAFSAQLHTQLADRMAATPHFPLVDAVYQRIMTAVKQRAQGKALLDKHG